MAGSTTKLALPYPTGTDKLVDGDNAIQALTDRLEVLLVGEQTPIVAFGDGVTSNSVDGGCVVYRFGKIAFIRFAILVTGSFGAGGAFILIPVGWRPDVRTVGLLANTGAQTPGWYHAESDGNVVTDFVLSAGAYRGSGSYVLP